MGSYSWINYVTARQQLALRLADPQNKFWTDPECGYYIQQALRLFNALTNKWRTPYVYNSTSLWNSLASLAGSPRLRTLTDTYCYTLMEYMLLEPATGGTWAGTSQFTIADLAQALQRRRDEMLQISNCNQSLMTGIPLTPNTRTTDLPDTVIDVARARFIPVSGNPTTLYRDDTVALEFFQAPLYQLDPGTPLTFSLSSEPPLSWTVNVAPSQPGTYEAVVLESGVPFAPPVPALLGIPDDFAWTAIWGALADLLGRESEAVDRQRSAFCQRRYLIGLELLMKTPWIMLGKVDNVAVSVDSIAATDRYMPEWDSNPSGFGPVIVTGGIDCLAAPVGAGIGMTVLGNAPVPVDDDDFVQVSRSNWDTVLDLAQVFATFKIGGFELEQAIELEERAIKSCAAENSRLKSMGCFSDILAQRGQAQDRNQERYMGQSSSSS